ncbi:hypothetical protein [Natronorubrum daqingense]|uniref:Uncharacterized protein n=1 Tax=Natronorubrum daqingense TaxID=588898 RepID=A0A1N6Z976_9EURY|nr:hypothetical protein [Natronorubrum daqingense]APX95421.1 hypothetical protein BB347_01660 [Natronorubrum daqingense]SIR23329.1 hypothetical protein SAMN05421809_0723 [Natronorubrum daqingense]
MVSPSLVTIPAVQNRIRDFWLFYRRYTDTTIHTAATAALAMFGLLIFLDAWFAAVAIACYVLPPLVLYVFYPDSPIVTPVEPEFEPKHSAESEPKPSAERDRDPLSADEPSANHRDLESPSKPAQSEDAGPSRRVSNVSVTDHETDTEFDGRGTDADNDAKHSGTDTGRDRDHAGTDTDQPGTDTDSDPPGTDTDTDLPGTDTDTDQDDGDTDSDFDGIGMDTDFDRDDGDTDTDTDPPGSDTDTDRDGTDTDTDPPGTDTDSDRDGTDTDSDSDS